MNGREVDDGRPLWREPLFWVLAVAVLARLPLLLYNGGILWPDSLSFLASAENIAFRGDFAQHRMFNTPLYPMFLALFLKLLPQAPFTGWLIVLAQHLLGIGSTLFLWLGGRRLFGAVPALVGALLFTLHPVVLYYEHVPHTETLFVFILAWLFMRLTRAPRSPGAWRAAELGFLCGLLTLTRPVAKYLVLTLLLWLALRLRRLKPALARGAFLLMAYAVAVLPWMAFNFRNSGYFGISKGEGTNLKLRAAYIGLAGAEAGVEPAMRAAGQAPAREARPRDPAKKRTKGRWPQLVEARARRDDAKLSNTVRLILRRPWIFARAAMRDFFLIMASPRSSVQFDDSLSPPVPCCLALKDFSTKVFPNRPAARSPLLRRLLHFQLARLKPGWSFVFVFFLLGAASFFADRGRDRLTGLLLLCHVAYFALSAAVFMKPIDRFFLPALGFYLLFAAWGAVFLLRVLRRRLRPEPAAVQ
jgi:4-amino-4-deoxy-L-arabinose transferase-like glycosyltransferase